MKVRSQDKSNKRQIMRERGFFATDDASYGRSRLKIFCVSVYIYVNIFPFCDEIFFFLQDFFINFFL